MVGTIKNGYWSVLIAITIAAGFSVVAYGQETQDGADKKKIPSRVGTEGQTASSIVLPDEVLRIIRQRLVTQFDSFLKDPKDYEQRVTRQCRSFPEGDLFSYVYPAMAYVNLALRDPKRKVQSIRQAQKLIDLAIPSVTKRVRPSGGKLENLSSYQKHAVYLGQLNLAIGAYCLISSDDRYDVLHRRISDLLHQALVKSLGRPLQSFPGVSWPFDTVPVLVSLQLYDVKTATRRSEEVIRRHLAWVRENATHQSLGLPYSWITNTEGKAGDPRGCDLSLRLCLLPHIDRAYAEQLYRQYVKNYWIDRGIIAGFAEWPNGAMGRQDMDSGPIVMGIGLGATGLGVGATIALEDREHLKRLCAELAAVDLVRPLFVAAQEQAAGRTGQQLRMIKLDKERFTGFLFGDAMLFYCTTWTQWDKREESKANHRIEHDH